MKTKNGYAGNKNAAKPDDVKSSSNINIRCKQQDNLVWKETAKAEGMNFTQWIIKTLNAATASTRNIKRDTGKDD